MSDRKQTILRLLTFACITALGVFAYLWLTRTGEKPKTRGQRERGQPVRTLEVRELAAVPRVVGYGEVAAARTWQGVAEVGGTIIEMDPDVQVGRVVAEGTVLFEIDPEQLELEKRRTQASAKGVRAQIAELEAREASAKNSLAVEQKVLALAQKELERSEALYRTGNVSQTELEAAEASVLSAQKSVVSLQNTLAELPATRRVLKAQLEEVDAGVTGAELVLTRTKIVAPFRMRIAELNVTTGQSVSGGQVLLVGEGLDTLEVTARLPIGGIDPLLPNRGQRAQPAQPESQPEPQPESQPGSQPESPADDQAATPPLPQPPRTPWLARVAEAITPTVRLHMNGLDAAWPARFSRFTGVDPLTRTTGVVVELDREQRRAGSRDVRLSSGMHVSVEFVGQPKPGCLALPTDAVHDGVVLVVGEGDRLERRTIEIAWAQEEFVCVAAGVSVGEQVIISQVVPAVDGMRVIPSVDQYKTERLLGLLGSEERGS